MQKLQNKKELMADFKAGKQIEVYQPGPFGGQSNGTVCIEAPHYPEPHRFYATAVIKDNIIVSLK